MTNLLTILLLLTGQVSTDGELPGDPKEAAKKAAADGDQPDSEKAEGDTKTDEGDSKDEPDSSGDEEEESESEAPPGASFWESGAIGLLLKGGAFMWPILLLGIVASGVIIERYRSLKMLRTDTGAVRGKVTELLEDDRVEEALKLCDREQGPVPAILSAGLRKFLVLRRLNYDPAKIEEQVVKAMDDYGVHVVAALERHLPVLATVSSVAPMLGFLGTVAGMITSFEDIQNMAGETDIVTAAAIGISQALLTTCFGLIVGIPVFMAFNYYSSIINRFVLDVEESATELIETVTLHMAMENRVNEEEEDEENV